MTGYEPRPLSWWCNLSREDLDREVEKRLEGWRQKSIGTLDGVGEKLRQQWEPPRPYTNLRGPIV